MRWWRALIVALLTGGSMIVPASAIADDERIFVFRDARITESSGLVDLGSVMVTTNDSGDAARLFVVNPSTGRTVGVTNLDARTVDVEALAPAGGGRVWVGDIGDNRRDRKFLSVYKVRVGKGRINAGPARYRLVYPRGAHDAESLFADRQGRLHVITKSVLGGVVYRAPLRLSTARPNRLQAAGRVVEFATDAALMPDGRHVIVRGPGMAGVYTFPRFQRIGSLELPRQRQGEGVSVGPGSRIRVSSEGAHSAVRQVALPPAIVQRLRPAAPSPTPSPSASTSPSASGSPSASPTGTPGPGGTENGQEQKQEERIEDQGRWLMWSIPAVLVLGAVGIGIGFRRRADGS